jgi:hypothetical protein
MRTAALVALPPVFIWLMVAGLIWAVEPEYLRSRAGRFMPFFFTAFVVFGELLFWLARSP